VDNEEFGWLIARLENQAANAPRAFLIKVLLISVAAYAALFLSLLLILLLFAGAVMHARTHGPSRGAFVACVLGLVTLPVFWVTLRTMLMRLPAPEGRAIVRADAPVLFELLDKMRAKLDGPPIHHVLIDHEYNACIAQRPRWGLVGPSVNYLVLGLPFLLGQSTSEMLAIVAHEYGHICGAHGRTGAWIYRQRLLFAKVLERVESTVEASFAHALMAKALHAFFPYFSAYTFVLSRQNEYEADQASVAMAGAPAAASSLIRSSLLGDWFHRDFWDILFLQADTRERPRFLPYQAMGTAFRMSHEEWASADCLKAAWRRDSDAADTHPCLRDRVQALGQSAARPAPVQRNAASTLLGSFGERLADEFDQAWWREQGPGWGERYRHATRSMARLRVLGGVALAELPLQELQELALLKADFESAQAAKPVLEHLLRQPGGPFPRASYVYGRILLDEGQRAGLTHLEKAARSDRHLVDDALRTGFGWLHAHEGEPAALQWVDAVMEARPA
jgi:Zn-dependent protease with chaperone function